MSTDIKDKVVTVEGLEVVRNDLINKITNSGGGSGSIVSVTASLSSGTKVSKRHWSEAYGRQYFKCD